MSSTPPLTNLFGLCLQEMKDFKKVSIAINVTINTGEMLKKTAESLKKYEKDVGKGREEDKLQISAKQVLRQRKKSI